MKNFVLAGLLGCGAALFFAPTGARCAPLPPSFSAALSETGARFITALASDGEGSVFVGTADEGILTYSRFDNRETWRHPRDNGDGGRSLANNYVCAFAVDHRNRTWAGNVKEGVSVSPGYRQGFRVNYGKLNGPLGSHVGAVAVSPLSGDVWMGTEAGVSIYNDSTHAWSYITRAEGLPSDQICAIAFERSGRVWLGTESDGLAWADASDNFKTWHHLDGPLTVPEKSQGAGLPSAQISALTVMHDGTVCIGTPNGLAWSRDAGQSWTWARGQNWQERKNDLYRFVENGAPAREKSESDEADNGIDLGSEDYVSCLSEDIFGRLWVSHRKTGLEVRDQTLRKIVRSDRSMDYVKTILPLDSNVLIGTFGRGLIVQPMTADAATPLTRVKDEIWLTPALNAAPAPWPAAANNPTTKQLQELLPDAGAKATPLQAGDAIALSDDWQTQGDWFGRYGRGVGVLCATQTIADDTIGQPDYHIDGENGPHQNREDGMRRYVARERWDDPRVLYNPMLGYRRQAEWNDHGEAYPQTQQGPDLWVKIEVPDGVYRLSFYFFNNDWDDGFNAERDYQLELKNQGDNVEDAYNAPTIARGRVHDFSGGVYKRFLIQGAHTYWMRIVRNGSFNTILSGVFIDKVSQPGPIDYLPLLATGNIDILPPSFAPADFDEDVPAKAKPLWQAAVDLTQSADASLQVGALTREGVLTQQKHRLLALRALMNRQLAPMRTAQWRWKLPLWTEEDRFFTARRYEEAYEAHLALNAQN